jgi:hypothetical protein
MEAITGQNININWKETTTRRKITYLLTELDLYQWLLGVCSVVMGFFSKLTWDFFKKKNNNLNNLEKKFEKLDQRVSKIEEGMIVTKSDGHRVSLSKYVQDDVKHTLDNNVKGVAGFMEMQLQERELQQRINQQILIKLNQLARNDK